MKKAWRWVGRGVALLVGLPLLLGLLWWLLNLRDAPAQPWPEALALPGNQLAAADNLAHALDGVAWTDTRFSLGSCQADAPACLPGWQALRAQMPGLRETQAGFVAACEALAERAALRYEDSLPERMTFDATLPTFAPLVHCHRWQLARAVDAALAGKGAVATQWLRQADRLDRALLFGGRHLAAQMVGANLWGAKLRALQAVALQSPALAPELADLAQLDARALLDAQSRWVRVEANVNRAAVDSLRTQACALPPETGRVERWLCPLTSAGLQPEYTTQLFAGRWRAVLQQLQPAGGLPQVLPGLRATLASGPEGLWPQLRHTMPLLFDEIARSAYAGYFERAADLQHSAEATALWLRDARSPLPERASPALRARLAPLAGGGWQIEALQAESTKRLPLRWPPLT